MTGLKVCRQQENGDYWVTGRAYLHPYSQFIHFYFPQHPNDPDLCFLIIFSFLFHKRERCLRDATDEWSLRECSIEYYVVTPYLTRPPLCQFKYVILLYICYVTK